MSVIQPFQSAGNASLSGVEDGLYNNHQRNYLINWVISQNLNYP